MNIPNPYSLKDPLEEGQFKLSFIFHFLTAVLSLGIVFCPFAQAQTERQRLIFEAMGVEI